MEIVGFTALKKCYLGARTQISFHLCCLHRIMRLEWGWQEKGCSLEIPMLRGGRAADSLGVNPFVASYSLIRCSLDIISLKDDPFCL
jgi:hypothetical protein